MKLFYDTDRARFGASKRTILPVKGCEPLQLVCSDFAAGFEQGDVIT